MKLKTPSESNSTRRVWVVSRALTVGPYQVDGEVSGAMLVVKHPGKHPEYFHGDGREWCSTKEGAIARCEVLRDNKIANIKKQMAKLENIDFQKLIEGMG